MGILLLLDDEITSQIPAGALGITSPAGLAGSADFTLKQGNTAPAIIDTLSFSNGDPANLSGATVEFLMRSLAATAPVAVVGTLTVTSATTGDVQFTPAATDTAIAGEFMQNWRVTFRDGTVMDFPTIGYNTVRIEENLTTDGGQQLVSLPDIKDYLGIPSNDRSRDAKLIRFIRAVRPIIENITGPIIPAVYDERHTGGGPLIQVRRRPSSTYDTSPVLELLTASEDLGATTRDLTIVSTPANGSAYSCMIDSIGTITRLTGGGGTQAFAGGSDSVHITYRAGQSAVPVNVYEGALELLRANYETTQMRGGGVLASADELETGLPLRSYVPRRVREILAPNSRAPSIA